MNKILFGRGKDDNFKGLPKKAIFIGNWINLILGELGLSH
jgi:hypothetical protein